MGGAELSARPEKSLCENLTYISHQSYLFKGTVRENLLGRQPGATDEQLWQALEPRSSQASCGRSRGLRPGSSSRRPICPAGSASGWRSPGRFCTTARVYIFDEATSNIDVESENDIMAAIEIRAGKNKTVIVISPPAGQRGGRRPDLGAGHGRCGEGDPPELVGARGVYAALWQAQRAREPRARRRSDEKAKRIRRDGAAGGAGAPARGYMVLAIVMGLVGAFVRRLSHRAREHTAPFRGGRSFAAARGLLPARWLVLRGGAGLSALWRSRRATTSSPLSSWRSCATGSSGHCGALPAKLEGADKGELISLITSDIELLEVFYAHTISPAIIALLLRHSHRLHRLVSLGRGLLALAAYADGGDRAAMVTPAQRGRRPAVPHAVGRALGVCAGQPAGPRRNPAIRPGAERLDGDARGQRALGDEERMKRTAGRNQPVTKRSSSSLTWACSLLRRGAVPGGAGTGGRTRAHRGADGLVRPVIALANLGSTLQNTFAAGNRVLDILDEEPGGGGNPGQEPVTFTGAAARTFPSPTGRNRSCTASPSRPKGRSWALWAAAEAGNPRCSSSSCGFGRPSGQVRGLGPGRVGYQHPNLRDLESFVTQETHLFRDSIRENLRIAKLDATDEEIEPPAARPRCTSLL